jgi:hypothetical protein
MNTKKDPHLYFKYNRGLGHFVASVLHSKAFGWLTKLITGKDKPCTVCSKRADALNVLFPIPFWKLFFKTEKEMFESLNKDLIDAGYSTYLSQDKTHLKSVKGELIQNIVEKPFNPLSDLFNDEKLTKYTFISSSDQEVDHLLVRTQYFKLKN